MGLLNGNIFRIGSLILVYMSSQPLSVSFGVNQLSLTPPARPKTSSLTFHSDTSGLTSAIEPENSTPRIVDDPAGGGYLPSLWEISILFKPNARI